ncbi:hypothetical protein EMMF5_001754 [Cystobasidiomycetes sp. EMM_F5]
MSEILSRGLVEGVPLLDQHAQAEVPTIHDPTLSGSAGSGAGISRDPQPLLEVSNTVEVSADSNPSAGSRTRRFLLKSQQRAKSFTRLTPARPVLERREATVRAAQQSSPSLSIFPLKHKRLSKFKQRFSSARSAPTTPALTPTPSTDRLGFFRTRPSSIVVSHRSSQLSPSPSTFFPASSFACPDTTASSAGSSYFPATDGLNDFVDADISTIADSATKVQTIVTSYDSMLPREIRVRILALVVQSSIDEYEARVQSDDYTFARACENPWVGQKGGLRDLVRLSGVSKAWRDMAFDGQLWKHIRISSTLGPDTFNLNGLATLARVAGSFLRTLDLRYYADMQGNDLLTIVEGCTGSSYLTRLTSIDLTGCRSISTRSLHFLLVRSPEIRELRLRAVQAVTSSTCDVIIPSATDKLQVLDVTLCRNLLAAALLDICQPGLIKLYSAKIPSMDDATVAAIPSRFPALEVLDFGYSRGISDAAFKDWSAGSLCDLKQLRLSGCSRLTDQTCQHLAGSLSGLEVLEMASIGSSLRDGGVVKLLETLKHLRKLDLEDAISLTDRALAAINTSVGGHRRRTSEAPLECVVLTNMPELTEPALLRLIRRSPRLQKLECSNSYRISDQFLKAFLHHVRQQKMKNAELSIVDCRAIGRQTFKENAQLVRTRRGIRTYENRHFEYLDSPQPGRCFNECDEQKV